MKFITEMIAKPVLSIFECKTMGLIKNFVFDKNMKKLKYLIIFDDDEQDEKTLCTKDIYSAGTDAVTIKNISVCSLSISQIGESDLIYPANAKVFTYSGKYCGMLNDVEIDKNYNVSSIKVDDKTIDACEILNLSNATIMLQDSKRIKLCNLKNKISPKYIKIQKEQKVSIMQDNQNVSNAKVIYKFNEDNVNYDRMITNYGFLLGRTLTSNLYSQSREVIARKDSKITHKTILEANKNAKLRELIMISK